MAKVKDDKKKKAKSKDKAAKKDKVAKPAGKAPLKVSPLAPASFPDLPIIDGVRFATRRAGVRYLNRTDVMLVEIAAGATIAGVFTRSAARSAAVLDGQAKLAALPGKSKKGFAIVVNSGNANTFTGARGASDVSVICEAAAAALKIPAAHVFTSSTGRDRGTAARRRRSPRSCRCWPTGWTRPRRPSLPAPS